MSTTLHTVNKSPFERNAFASCLAHLMPGDAILAIEDGVVGLRKSTAFADSLSSAAKDHKVYVLGPDLGARGMSADDLIDGVSIVDYDGFVDLVAEHQRTQAWL
ncbi:MAG: sulfurtransferase complex subunit TusB [Hyphomicrobiales bacterium]|nr:MAG: sulfurtransferase complex subunit TusB [Hyphomicrobiales bacterium]